MAELRHFLEGVLSRTEGLQAVVVSDRDGVVVSQVSSPEAPEQFLEPTVSSTFSLTSDQARKIGLGRNKMILTTFNQHRVLQFNHSPLILTLIGTIDANTGGLIEIGYQLDPILHVMSEHIAQTFHDPKSKEDI